MKGYVAKLLFIAGATLLSIPSFADDKPPCTGDQTACSTPKIVQHGTDPASAAHVLIQLENPNAGMIPQYVQPRSIWLLNGRLFEPD
jgi:hypothetical protein